MKHAVMVMIVLVAGLWPMFGCAATPKGDNLMASRQKEISEIAVLADSMISQGDNLADAHLAAIPFLSQPEDSAIDALMNIGLNDLRFVIRTLDILKNEASDSVGIAYNINVLRALRAEKRIQRNYILVRRIMQSAIERYLNGRRSARTVRTI